jgi:hypothetical protein
MANLKVNFPKEWTFETGEEYPAFTNDGDEGKAFYFGKMDGQHIFYRKVRDELRRYTCDTAKISWMSDAGDDEPCRPVVEIYLSYRTKVTPDEEKLIKTLFDKYEQRAENSKALKAQPHYSDDIADLLTSIPQL